MGSTTVTWDGGRWAAHLDTTILRGPGCYAATAWLDGLAAGSFRIDLRSARPTRARR